MLRTASKAIFNGAALAASLVVISLLAGCGGGGSDSTAAGAGSAQTANANALGTIENFGQEAGPGDRAAMAKAVQEFLRARADGDWPTVCSLVAASELENLRQFVSQNPELKNKGCPDLIAAATKIIPAKELAGGKRIQVTGARVEGDHGFVLYRDASGTRSALPVAREGNSWKASALVGPSLP